jgi:two-component system alkaline phosphatase synthesis response regulator PhoP
VFRVSLVGQDASSVESLARTLGQNGYSCSVMTDGETVVATVVEQSPDIVLLENDSYYRIAELATEIRKTCDVPVVAVVRGDLLSRVNGHFNNVDDFVAKPFSPDELQLRIKRLLRRANGEGEEILKCGELTIDMAKCEVFVGERMVVLTFKEYELLKFLVANQGRVCTREALLDKVWGFDYFGGDRTVDVHIRRLRSKIEDPTHTFIDTVRNIGYRLKADR